jgi:hypothetical protein
MKIVLDTTEIVRDPLLRGVHLQVLTEFARQSGAEILVPEVVLQEAMRHMDEKSDAAAAEMRKAIRSVRLWLGGDAPLRETEELLDGASRKSYVGQLRARLEYMGVRILDHPPVPHARLLSALRARRKPFGNDGAGYQDALVWCTVASLAREHPEVVLVTQNENDFPTDSDDRPVPELLDWLEEDSVPADRVRIYHSAEAFSAAVILPKYPLVTEKVEILAGRHRTIDLRAAIGGNAARIVLAAIANTPNCSVTTSMSEDAELELGDLRLELKEVTSLSDEEIQIVVVCTFNVGISAVRASDEAITVLDSIIKTLDRWLGDTLIVSAELAFIFDRSNGTVRSFEVGDAMVRREGRGQIGPIPVTWRVNAPEQEPGETE